MLCVTAAVCFKTHLQTSIEFIAWVSDNIPIFSDMQLLTHALQFTHWPQGDLNEILVK